MIQNIYDFLKVVDHDFPIPLSERVNLYEYSSKITKNAIIFAMFDEGQVIALVAIYCNSETGYAYIPLVAVHPKVRGLGMSKTLMTDAILYATKKGFEKIGIHTENPIATNLYVTLGFKIIEDSDRKYLELNIK